MTQGERLRLAREEQGYSRETLGALIKRSAGTIVNWEKGPENGGTEPNDGDIRRLAEALDVNPEWIQSGQGEKQLYIRPKLTQRLLLTRLAHYKMTQQELADRIGHPVTDVEAWETGKRVPTDEEMRKIGRLSSTYRWIKGLDVDDPLDDIDYPQDGFIGREKKDEGFVITHIQTGTETDENGNVKVEMGRYVKVFT